jgi:SAM-dependent methyltransferase
MLLVRHIIASSANHCRAVFSPHATALNTLYATVMLWHATKRLLSKATFCMITGKRMNTYYTGKHASRYNRTWRTFLQKTLTATLSAIDVEALQQRASIRERPLRILDAACGTGLLLEQFTHLFPHAELYGIDESQAMLAQAAQLLQDRPHVHLAQASLGGGETAGLPYALASFDLITCTNTWHYLKDPAATLKGLGHLLVSGGQVVIEDYVLRGFPFPWKAFEWLIKYYDPQHIRLYTLSEAQALCRDIGFQVVLAKPFKVDLFCQGWVLCTLSG